MAGPYQATSGDVIALDNPKAGALTLSTSLANYSAVSTDPIRMFARRDAFRTVAEAIASGMAGVPLDFYRTGSDDARSKVQPYEHRVAAALERPVPGLTQTRLVEACQLDLVLHDRYAILLLDQPDGSLQLVRLPGNWISFAVDSLRRITDVLLHNGKGDPLPIPIERVIFDVGYDPNPSGKETRGYSISRTLEAAATELERGAEYRSKLLAGGPRVPMYISRPKDAPKWEKGGRERFEQTLGDYNANSVTGWPLLEDGMEFKATPQTVADDVKYLEAKKAAQIEFAIALHFPPELVGYREGTNSNVAAFREQLYVDVLGTRFKAQREAWNAGLDRAGYLDPGEYVEENVAVRLAGNPILQAQILQTQTGAPIRTVNESRKLFNLPPVAGGDELIVPLNVTRGGLASPTDTGPKQLTLGRTRRLSIEAPASSKARTKAGYDAALETQRERFGRDITRQFTKFAATISKGLGDDSAPRALDAAFDHEAEALALAAVILPHSYALAQTKAHSVLDRWADEDEAAELFDDEVMLPWLTKAAESWGTLAVAGVTASLAAAIASTDWKAAVASVLENLEGPAGDGWATTIGTSSASFGAADAAKALGLDQKTWQWSGSSNGRPEHQAMDGETVGAGELFSNGLRWPGDPTGGADQNAECGCTVEYSRSGA